jgi:hypothetical protein
MHLHANQLVLHNYTAFMAAAGTLTQPWILTNSSGSGLRFLVQNHSFANVLPVARTTFVGI